MYGVAVTNMHHQTTDSQKGTKAEMKKAYQGELAAAKRLGWKRIKVQHNPFGLDRIAQIWENTAGETVVIAIGVIEA